MLFPVQKLKSNPKDLKGEKGKKKTKLQFIEAKQLLFHFPKQSLMNVRACELRNSVTKATVSECDGR